MPLLSIRIPSLLICFGLVLPSETANNAAAPAAASPRDKTFLVMYMTSLRPGILATLVWAPPEIHKCRGELPLVCQFSNKIHTAFPTGNDSARPFIVRTAGGPVPRTPSRTSC